MTIVGDGMQRRDYTHVQDIVSANIKIINSNLNGFETFNVGTGINYRVLEIAEMFGGPYKFIPKRDGEARETLADISHIKEKLSWLPSLMIKDWIKDSI